MINHNILLCDDLESESDSMIDMIKQGLKKFDRHIAFESCIDIVDSIANPPVRSLKDVGDYSLLLLDVMWHDEVPHGIEIARMVREAYPNLPIIIITERASLEHFQELIPLQISGYFKKGDRNDIGWAKQILDIIKTIYEDCSGQPLYQKLNQVLASDPKPWHSEIVKQSAASVWQNSNSYTKWHKFWFPWANLLANKKINSPVSVMGDWFKTDELLAISAQPSMRGHLNHVLYVYFTGYVISHSMPEFKRYALNAAKKLIKDELSNLDDNEYWDAFQFAWLLCATLHDTAYPLEALPSILNRCTQIMTLCSFADFNRKTLGNLKAKEINWKEKSRFMNTFKSTFACLQGDLSLATKKANWLKKNTTYEKKTMNFNHGIASAVLFLTSVEDWEKYTEVDFNVAQKFNDWTATAMALHAMKKAEGASEYPLRLAEDPLSFLLALCDELQIWSRNRPDDTEANNFCRVELENLEITDDTISAVINYVPYKGLDEEVKADTIASIGAKINDDHREIETYLKPEPFKIKIDNRIRSWNIELPKITLG